jgi:hypothetical protein
MSENEDYQRGHRAAMAEARTDLAATLRVMAVRTGEPDEEVLSDAKVREIFASVFGVKAMDDEFGSEPSGEGVRKAAGL